MKRVLLFALPICVGNVLQQLYESEVPEAVREYVDSKSAPAARPRRPAKASVTKQKEGDEHGTA